MAQLSIPAVPIGALIDIADLGTLDYSRPQNGATVPPRAQRQNSLCPCTCCTTAGEAL